MAARPRPSLKARAIALLAQREHSRTELRQKLLARMAADSAAAAAASEAGPATASAADSVAGFLADASAAPRADGSPEHSIGESDGSAGHQVDALLDWLEAHDYLSAARFAESRVHARRDRYGSERIRRELAQHGVALEPAALAALREGDDARARALWAKKFGAAACEPAGRARQARFLAARGFSGDVIRRLVRGDTEGD